MRHRIAVLLARATNARGMDEFTAVSEGELGIDLPRYSMTSSVNWKKFCSSAELRDVLDIVTVFFRHLARTGRGAAVEWRNEVARIMREENCSYRLDEHAGVHYTVDGEFERNRVSTVGALSEPRYSAALAAFEATFPALDQIPPDAKTAVRQVFFAAENLFKLMFPAATLLGGTDAERLLPSRIDPLYDRDASARAAAHRMIASFKAWITAVHQHRHEPGEEEPVQPPLTLAVLLISQGTSYVRWLAEVDQQTRS